MRRLAILVTVVLTTAAAPLAALCGVDCGVETSTAVHTPSTDAACPLHEPPAPAGRRHACDHDHHVAPATSAKADPALAGKDLAAGVVCLAQPADVIADLRHPASHARSLSIARAPLGLFPLRI